MSHVQSVTDAGRAEAATTGGGRHLGVALLVIATAQLMVVLDSTVVNVALPHIQRALGFSGCWPGMGGQRIRPGVRRAAAARRPGR